MVFLPRRRFLQSTAALAATGLAASAARSQAAAAAPLKFRLGIVTYNVAADWDLPTILKVCKAVGLVAGRAAHHAQARRRADR